METPGEAIDVAPRALGGRYADCCGLRMEVQECGRLPMLIVDRRSEPTQLSARRAAEAAMRAKLASWRIALIVLAAVAQHGVVLARTVPAALSTCAVFVEARSPRVEVRSARVLGRVPRPIAYETAPRVRPPRAHVTKPRSRAKHVRRSHFDPSRILSDGIGRR